MAASSVFVDTSAIYGLLVASDHAHARARRALARLEETKAALLTSSYVVQETVTLLQARVGVAAVISFGAAVLPVLEVVYVDEATLKRGLAALVASGNRSVSLTDWTSFDVMRERGVRRAFAFDPHFRRQGFELVA